MLFLFLGMKFFKNLLLITLSVSCLTKVSAQSTDDARALIKQGVQLTDAGKYPDAIAKYNEALKIDPASLYADYEMAFTLFLSNKGDDGIPYLEKVIAQNGSLNAGAYDLLGSIYDKDNQKEKSLDAYNAGIKANPDYQRLYYNRGLVYFRYKQYAEAEKDAIEAIKLDPKHASSQRMYALVCFHQNKRVPALLGFCSFILLESNTPRSAESFNNIQHIIQGGVLKADDGKTTILFSPDDSKDMGTLNAGISLIVVSGQLKKLSGMELLQYELKSIFELAGQLSEKKTDKDFFWKYYADYFYKLAQSPNMPAFTRLISAAANKDDYTKWTTEHSQQLTDLDNWVKGTERGF